MSSSDARPLDFAQARANRIADAIDGPAERIKLTDGHAERDARSEVILQANQIIAAQQQRCAR